MIKFSVTCKDADKKLTRQFESEGPVLLSDEDAQIKDAVSVTLTDFKASPDTITVKATLEL